MISGFVRRLINCLQRLLCLWPASLATLLYLSGLSDRLFSICKDGYAPRQCSGNCWFLKGKEVGMRALNIDGE